MCSIIGIRGQNVNRRLMIMLDSLKHRGPDAEGAYSNNQLYFKDNLQEMPESDFILAHNLLSIVGNNEKQPISGNKITIIANAEIYNYNQLIEDYNLYNLKTSSDCEIILKLIEKFYVNDLKNAVLKIMDLLDGDYAFCATDGKDYIVLRDSVGVKPVYYANDEETFAFASEQKALKNINLNNIKSLKPTEAIYNNQIISIRNEFSRREELFSYDELKEKLKQNIINATRKRVQNLDKVALLFSAGVDSTLLAVLLKKFNINTTLYTIGTQNSQDLKFAKEVSEDLELPLKTWIINQDVVEDYFEETINAIEDTNLMKIGVGMTIKLTTKLASSDNHKVIISGQGADELFCGYNRYKYKFNSKEELLKELTYDLNNMYEVNLERDDKATMSNSVELRVPYLDKEVIETSLNIPIDFMLFSDEDNMRKHILRDIAFELGVPDYIAYRPKKAAQYGTGIDKIIKKKILKKEEYRKLVEKNI